MNELVDNEKYEFLWKALANPADHDHAIDLQLLSTEFPQSGVLHALLASADDKRYLKSAAVHFDPQILRKLTTTPESLAVVTSEQIIYNGEFLSEAARVHQVQDAVAEDNAFVEFENIVDEPQADEHLRTETAADEPKEETPVVNEEIRYFHQDTNHDIDDEVYDEIVGIEDIGIQHMGTPNHTAPIEEPVQKEEATESYFVFDSTPAIVDTQETEQQQPKSDVSRYNDEKMPYTFMWWLDKTRKEHAATYQPYISKTTPAVKQKKTKIADELQKQYYQNIVSTNSIDEVDKNTPPVIATAQPLRKEDKIIERFIQEEPQIKHPSGIKLDNENKARRSSEDKEELVTETLARIYIEQMLYHKAILTYKKLMLKFPEKSVYFAGQIEQLESKIN
ncbi:MAG: hypothetical protein V4560_02415 [Bacteroidota bacterium]